MAEANLKREIDRLKGDNARLATALDSLDHHQGIPMPSNLQFAFPQYNGVSRDSLPIAQFLEDFEAIADSYGLDNKRKALVLIRCLKDHASFKYREIVKITPTIKEDYNNLSKELKTYFQRLEGDMGFGSAAFQGCKQSPNQSVVDYYNELSKHARRAYPAVRDEVFQHIMLEKFLKGLILPIR
jgi:hypothetical protein